MAGDNSTLTKLALGGTALLGLLALGVVLTRDSTPAVPDVNAPKAESASSEVAKESAVEQPALSPEQYTLTASGLGIHPLTEGSGEQPSEGSIVSVHYTGWVEGGDPFFSTRDRKEPMRWPLGKGQLKGLDEGVSQLKKGGKAVLRVPPELAFGQQRRGRISPGATLVIEAELVDIAPPRVAPDAPPALEDSAWTTTESGLKYHDLKVGTGTRPSTGQTVAVEYTGWLTDGTRFDSSLTKASPIRFPIGTGRVIKGWDEGVGDMTVGTERVLYIPWQLAYGESGRKPLIPPKSDLIFQVELVGVE